MGYTINAQSNQDSEYVQAIKVLGHSFTRRLETPLYWIDAIFQLSKPGREFARKVKELHQFTLKVIRERKREILSCPELQESYEETASESDVYGLKGTARKPFLDILLREHIKDPENFTEEHVREEVDTFMFEGHDTTAMGMSWAIYLIALHEEHQDLIHQELDTIFGSDKTRPVTSDDLKQMKYMECCLKKSYLNQICCGTLNDVLSTQTTYGDHLMVEIVETDKGVGVHTFFTGVGTLDKPAYLTVADIDPNIACTDTLPNKSLFS
ncbi:hypothetical protein HPB51_022745 [Rhipicephalus microplus]|uniref:Cytochrome n=1 Tax=Rhipicephalus microplus TaxID=6941 RepID=A0A9J6EJL3_RHIMP|nr:hypothetical protein HPB51_022745 [Rhipicephalus microplus]